MLGSADWDKRPSFVHRDSHIKHAPDDKMIQWLCLLTKKNYLAFCDIHAL